VPLPKLNHVQPFAPWEWVVVTGAYFDDIDAIVWRQLLWVSGLSALAVAAENTSPADSIHRMHRFIAASLLQH